MPAGRYFRGLTTFDLLGNLVPGTVLLVAGLASLPDPPTPATPGGYLLFGVVAFSLGHFVQRYASVATGDRRSFDWTMDAARQQGRSPEDTGDEGPDTDGTERDGVDGDADQSVESVVESTGGRLERGLGALWRAVTLWSDALLDPILRPLRPPRGSVLEERIIANRAWKHLRDSFDLSPGTENHSVLFHLMSSELDDVATPSRAVRFQAIRNFQRGMWTATWAALTLWVGVFAADRFVEPGTRILGVEYQRAFLLGLPSPTWHVLAILALAVVGFRRLTEVYEEEFIEYLFTDFVVATRCQGEGGPPEGTAD